VIGLKRKFNPFGAVAASADQDGLHHMDKIVSIYTTLAGEE
jgi:hypothetical protein